jgi:hypothetical protein
MLGWEPKHVPRQLPLFTLHAAMNLVGLLVQNCKLLTALEKIMIFLALDLWDSAYPHILIRSDTRPFFRIFHLLCCLVRSDGLIYFIF